MLIFSTSGCQTTRSRTQQSGNETLEDPAIQFSQDLTFLEPPSQRRLTDPRFRNQQPTSEPDSLELPIIKPLEVKGDIEISGSSDINPLNDLIYKRFVKEGYAGTMSANGIYSNTAIKLFCEEAKFDIITVSRPMNESEIATCQANNRQPIDFLIAKDALVFVVHRQDNFVKNLTFPRLREIFQAENWSDVNSNWPNESIERFLLLPGNFLFERFPNEFSSEEEPIINSLNTNFYKFYQPLSQDLSATRYGVGYISYPYYQSNSKSLRAVPVEGHLANVKTVQNGDYPFVQNIFLYADLNQLPQKPQVSAFINFYLTHLDQEIDKVGYLPLSEQELDNSKVNWLKAMGIEN
ncbi:PstS family phosphate ABC transporter substrate-binding protein [Xenococcus sp. PCC 7305]|uniref:PstS family phosphate ABC transporter substrate-binding protein n=1 Tax=Xenococcus sp. PCC 7305 TaxID=102125 RepID=UPI00030787AB|nr:substrate-binding domain-containing protein [Xenococcus sp. PCC 7305]